MYLQAKQLKMFIGAYLTKIAKLRFPNQFSLQMSFTSV